MDRLSMFHMNLECSALGPDQLIMVSMTGQEEISRLFAFQVVVRPTEGVLIAEDFQEIFDGTATLSFGPDKEHPIHGVIRRIELMPTRNLETLYRMHFVPRMWDTQLTRGSWIYQDKTVEQIVTKAFTEILPEGARLEAGTHFDFNLGGDYTPNEYVVQYEESIFAFVSRQLEHFGVFYYFDHSGENEMAVMGDANGQFPELTDFERIEFLPGLNISDFRESIQMISSDQRVVSKSVALREYNYRTPSLPLHTNPVDVDSVGIGEVHVSNEGYWTPTEGAQMTAMRSQEMFMDKLRITAQSCVRGLRAGHRFALTGTVPEQLGLARDYLVVGIEHFYGDSNDQADVTEYTNRLSLIPLEMVYRPARITPKPRIYGFMHATVDSESEDDGIHAPVDEWGRYKVVMPYDVAGETGGRATCWIRLATPASGASWGMAQQIHIGQEVAIFHLDGDPDRPVIAGALPNFENSSVVTSNNSNVSQMTSRGGSGFRVRDA